MARANLHIYSDPSQNALRSAIASYTGFSDDWIVAGEAVFLLPNSTFLREAMFRFTNLSLTSNKLQAVEETTSSKSP